MTDLDRQTCVVVGAGLLGLCTALQLQRKGQRVLLVDGAEPGQGASRGNAGFLATELIDPLSSWSTVKSAPGLLLGKHGALSIPRHNLPSSLPWVVRFILAALPARVDAGRSALASLNRQAVSAWQECLSGIGKSSLLVRSGYLLGWEDKSGIAPARQHLKHLHDWDISAALVQGAELEQLEPALIGRLSHALHFPDAWRVQDPAWVCAALFEAFVASGGVFLKQHVDALDTSQALPGLTLGGRQRTFAKIALCAGVHSSALLSTLGIKVPLMAERGYHLSVASSQTILNRPVCSIDRKIFLNPLDSGLRVAGISELGGVNMPAQSARFDTLRYHAKHLLPDYASAFESASEWMGMRPTLPDSLPVIDVHPQNPNLGFAFGNQHLGLTQAAISARLIGEKLLGMTPSIDLSPFRITRF